MATLDLTKQTPDPSCHICQIATWHPDLFVWIHTVVSDGLPIPKVCDLVNEQIRLFNKKNPDKAKIEILPGALRQHLKSHVPGGIQLLNEIGQSITDTKLAKVQGAFPPDVQAKINALATQADQDVINSVARMQTVLDRVYQKFLSLDESMGAVIDINNVPGYAKLADMVTKGLEVLIKVRSQDRALQAAITHFADKFAMSGVDIFMPMLDDLVVELNQKGHPEAAKIVAARMRDIFVRTITGSAKVALDDVKEKKIMAG